MNLLAAAAALQSKRSYQHLDGSYQFKSALTLLRNHYAGNVHLIVLISERTAWMRFDLFPMSGRKALAKCVFM